MKANKGFTLIELLVVIAIIVILAGIVIFATGNVKMKARDAERVAYINQIRTAISQYSDDNDSNYPDALANLAPIYLQATPVPPEGGSYLYCVDNAGSQNKNYHLGATLEDSNNGVLKNDLDFDSTGWTPTAGTCFDGTDPVVYDVGDTQ